MVFELDLQVKAEVGAMTFQGFDFAHENKFFSLGNGIALRSASAKRVVQILTRWRFYFSISFPDIVFHPWKKEETGNQSRVILYTITLTNPLAPKTATVTETQVSGGLRAGSVF